MAAFRVGQRVRIVSCYDNTIPEISALVGSETTVIGICEISCPAGWEQGFMVAAQVHWAGGLHHPGFPSHQLEPIVDDGRKVVSWSECLWQPSHEGVPA